MITPKWIYQMVDKNKNSHNFFSARTQVILIVLTWTWDPQAKCVWRRIEFFTILSSKNLLFFHFDFDTYREKAGKFKFLNSIGGKLSCVWTFFRFVVQKLLKTIPEMKLVVSAAFIITAESCKILCLHGGGSSGDSFRPGLRILWFSKISFLR